jgi:hypothetical protein
MDKELNKAIAKQIIESIQRLAEAIAQNDTPILTESLEKQIYNTFAEIIAYLTSLDINNQNKMENILQNIFTSNYLEWSIAKLMKWAKNNNIYNG